MKMNCSHRNKIIAVALSLMIVAGTAAPVCAVENKDTSVSKEETVYVIANQDGNADKIIVSEWLKNTSKKSLIKDFTELKKIENVKGQESFTQKDGKGTWNAQGNDIYYQGEIQKELPVTMKVSYYLDGNKVSAKEIAGKSGTVKIRFDYTNNQKLDGVYVPFVLLTSLGMDNEKFKNVEVTNGKVINDGQKSLVVGYALPGLTESLQLDDTDVSIPNYVEVTCQAESFALEGTMTVATSSLLEDLNLGDINSMGDLKAALDKLESAAAQLQEGSEKLQSGADELSKGTGSLYKGTKSLKEKVAELGAGLKAAKDGTATLQKGSKKLVSGTETLQKGAGSLNAGAAELSAGIDQSYAALQQTIAGDKQVLSGLKSAAAQLPPGTLDQAIAGLEKTIAGQEQVAASMVKGNKGLKDGALALQAGAGALDQGAANLNNGLVALSGGVKDLNTGITKAYKGAGLMEDGTRALNAGAKKVNAGAGNLATGAKDLSGGIAKFKNDGLDKLVKVFDGDISKVTDRMRALQKAASDYQSFAGKKADVKGTVKFIYKTDEIK